MQNLESKNAQGDGHDRRKREVRQRILAAAAELIVEAESVDFPTRMLADRAGVSMATPFNHFGSKLGVLMALMDHSLQRIDYTENRKRHKGIARLVHGADPVINFYAAQPALYRPLFAAILGAQAHAQPVRGASPLGRAISMWRELAEEAKVSGLIANDQNTRILATSLEYSWLGTVHAWLQRDLSAAEWRHVAQHSLAVGILPAIDERHRGKVEAAIRALEQKGHPFAH